MINFLLILNYPSTFNINKNVKNYLINIKKIYVKL